MASATTIEWTQTVHPDGSVSKGFSWNFLRGCSRVSEGCRINYENCVRSRIFAGDCIYRIFQIQCHIRKCNVLEDLLRRICVYQLLSGAQLYVQKLTKELQGSLGDYLAYLRFCDARFQIYLKFCRAFQTLLSDARKHNPVCLPLGDLGVVEECSHYLRQFARRANLDFAFLNEQFPYIQNNTLQPYTQQGVN